jgi:glycosyltransferase involved in cell wall biosynthesis
MKERILQVNLDGTGGAFSLMYQLQKQMKSKYIFDYYWMGKFIRSDRSAELEKLGSRIYEDNLRKNKIMGHLLLPWHFYVFLKKHRYNTVHINADLAYKELLYALPAKKAGVKKIILHSHSSGVNGNLKVLKLILHSVCKPFLKKYSKIYLTCSKLAANWMFGQSDNVIMLKNGVDLTKFAFSQSTRDRVRKQLGLNNIVLGMVGNLSYQKNPEFLISIMKQLNVHQEYTLLFVGNGKNRNKVENYAKDMGVYDSCIFLGNTNKVVELLDAMDIFVMPSRFEGLPVSAVEAQTNGLPCVISDKVTDEVKIIQQCSFLPINRESISVWIEKIKNTKLSYDRKDAVKMVKEKGFDIKETAKKLESIYEG